MGPALWVNSEYSFFNMAGRQRAMAGRQRAMAGRQRAMTGRQRVKGGLSSLCQLVTLALESQLCYPGGAKQSPGRPGNTGIG